MRYYSTNHNSPEASLSEVVVRGLAPDGGLYMPERIPQLPAEFFDHIDRLSFQEIAFTVARALFGEDIPEADLREIVYDTLRFDCPIVEVEPGIFSLELFHGPTLAFKDVGARFMARMLRHMTKGDAPEGQPAGDIHVLVATSGDTGSAVANGFLGVDGIKVHVLYPKGKVSAIQECQFTTLGRNITALEVDGTFDDCQALVKKAFLDPELNAAMKLTSANSINVARFLPQAFYYFNAYARLKALGLADKVVISVPSGNFGNITAAIIAKRMGLPIHRFVAANNANDVVYQYLQTGVYDPRPSIATIANAMDVGAPSNFARVLDIYGDEPKSDLSGATYSDDRIRATMLDCYERTGYTLDPHGACGYQALRDQLRPGEVGVFGETAHPAKFRDTVQSAIGVEVAIPERLAAFMQGTKSTVPLTPDFPSFRSYLLSHRS